MTKITYRRTINIGDFESLSFETTSEHDDPNIARLIAAKSYLELCKSELVRIYNIKVNCMTTWDRVLQELDGVEAELNNLRR